MGHSAFGLADEYEYYAGCGVEAGHDQHPATEPTEPNVTIDTDRAKIKWRDLIAAATAIPTTTQRRLHAVRPAGQPGRANRRLRGRALHHCGAFRPEFDCRMRALGRPFCAVCTRRIRQVLEPFRPAPRPSAPMLSGLVMPVCMWRWAMVVGRLGRCVG